MARRGRPRKKKVDPVKALKKELEVLRAKHNEEKRTSSSLSNQISLLREQLSSTNARHDANYKAISADRDRYYTESNTLRNKVHRLEESIKNMKESMQRLILAVQLQGGANG